jgi:hypothetical protein
MRFSRSKERGESLAKDDEGARERKKEEKKAQDDG